MTRETFRAIFTPLVIARGAEFDAFRWAAYGRVLQDLPEGLLTVAVTRGMMTPRQEYEAAFPDPGTIRTWAEEARQALIAAHPYEGCCDCEDSPGWRDVTHADGVAVERCPCRRRYREKLAALEAEPGLVIPAAVPRRELAEVTVEQLPEAIRAGVRAVAQGKGIR